MFTSAASDWVYQRRRAVMLVGAAGVAVYLSHKLYTSKQASRTKSSLVKLWEAGQAITGAYGSLAEVFSLLSTDLNQFLRSDASELPQSFLQVAKLIQHKDVQSAIHRTLSTAVESTASHLGPRIAPFMLELVDKLVSAALSQQGRSVIGLAASMAARNSVAAVCEHISSGGSSQATALPSGSLQQLMELVLSEDGQRLLRTLIAASTTSAVGTYVDKTSHMNVFDDLLSSMSRQEHLQGVQTILNSSCRTFVQELAACYAAGLLSANRNDGSAKLEPAGAPHSVGGNVEPAGVAGASGSSSWTVGPSRRRTSEGAGVRAPGWLENVVMLTRQPEVQNLAVALTKSTVHEVVDTLVNSEGPSGIAYYVGLSASKMYTVMSVASALLLYAVAT